MAQRKCKTLVNFDHMKGGNKNTLIRKLILINNVTHLVIIFRFVYLSLIKREMIKIIKVINVIHNES
jgi:hypothetical protein